MEARCPLGEALGESCKDTSLRSLSTEEMDLALLRAGHAVSLLPSLEGIHKAVF